MTARPFRPPSPHFGPDGELAPELKKVRDAAPAGADKASVTRERTAAQRAAAKELSLMASAETPAGVPDVMAGTGIWWGKRRKILDATRLTLHVLGQDEDAWWQDVQQASRLFALLRTARPLSDRRLQQKVLATAMRLKADLENFMSMTAYGEFNGTPVHEAHRAVEDLIKQLPAAFDAVKSLLEHLAPEPQQDSEERASRQARGGRPPDRALKNFAADMARLYGKGFGKPAPRWAQNSTFVRFAVACAKAAGAELTKSQFREHHVRQTNGTGGEGENPRK